MPSDVRFADLRKLLERHGWRISRVNGSHHLFSGPNRPLVSIPVHGGKVKHVYQRQIEKAIADLQRERR